MRTTNFTQKESQLTKAISKVSAILFRYAENPTSENKEWNAYTDLLNRLEYRRFVNRMDSNSAIFEKIGLMIIY